MNYFLTTRESRIDFKRFSKTSKEYLKIDFASLCILEMIRILNLCIKQETTGSGEKSFEFLKNEH